MCACTWCCAWAHIHTQHSKPPQFERYCGSSENLQELPSSLIYSLGFKCPVKIMLFSETYTTKYQKPKRAASFYTEHW